MGRAFPGPCLAASAVRALAIVATVMPTYPAPADNTAPRMYVTAASGTMTTAKTIASATTKKATQVYSFFKNARAPF
ncbi:unannotated protein [freshwater metagenome]|uniref:Unannotated protein n=1 Tax=freshwater metagenome TaxID=449393 RepID=A0A6J6JYL2_9ZZZZ